MLGYGEMGKDQYEDKEVIYRKGHFYKITGGELGAAFCAKEIKHPGAEAGGQDNIENYGLQGILIGDLFNVAVQYAKVKSQENKHYGQKASPHPKFMSAHYIPVGYAASLDL
jgi:hypothetical protein